MKLVPFIRPHGPTIHRSNVLQPIYLGKYGHKLLQFPRPAVKADAGDVNGLYVIAGHTVDGGTSVSDVFVDGPGLHCNTGGKSCSGHGKCQKSTDFGGCTCVDGSTVLAPL